jgi:hypothetical protein
MTITLSAWTVMRTPAIEIARTNPQFRGRVHGGVQWLSRDHPKSFAQFLRYTLRLSLINPFQMQTYNLALAPYPARIYATYTPANHEQIKFIAHKAAKGILGHAVCASRRGHWGCPIEWKFGFGLSPLNSTNQQAFSRTPNAMALQMGLCLGRFLTFIHPQ